MGLRLIDDRRVAAFTTSWNTDVIPTVPPLRREDHVLPTVAHVHYSFLFIHRFRLLFSALQAVHVLGYQLSFLCLGRPSLSFLDTPLFMNATPLSFVSVYELHHLGLAVMKRLESNARTL